MENIIQNLESEDEGDNPERHEDLQMGVSREEKKTRAANSKKIIHTDVVTSVTEVEEITRTRRRGRRNIDLLIQIFFLKLIIDASEQNREEQKRESIVPKKNETYIFHEEDSKDGDIPEVIFIK